MTLMLPLQLAFEFESLGLRLMNDFLNLFFIADLLLNFFTTYEVSE